MTPARDRILASIRDGLVRAVLPEAGAAPDRRWPPAAGDASAQALVAQFSSVLTALSGHVHRAAAADVAGVVLAIAAG